MTAVKGKVTLNGQNVEDGRITFTPIEGEGKISDSSGAAAGQIKNGEYNIPEDEGPIVGKHSVSITASRKTGKQIEAAMPAPPGTMIDVVEELVPAKFNSRTELTADLVSGENTKDFALEGEAQPAAAP
jgi:hypothetical protein